MENIPGVSGLEPPVKEITNTNGGGLERKLIFGVLESGTASSVQMS